MGYNSGFKGLRDFLFVFRGSIATEGSRLLHHCRGLVVTQTPQSVRILWESDKPHVETFTWQQTTLTRDRYVRPSRYSNPQSQQASSRRPTS